MRARGLTTTVADRGSRRGTAMLELVLALTPLLFIMALMILVGSLGSWRVRNHATARQAAFRSVWPRTTAGDGAPPEWPTRGAGLSTASMTVPLFSTDPFERHLAVRGPVYNPVGAAAVHCWPQFGWPTQTA